MCAVQNGKSIDTTMGLTPLEGLVMGSRCGDIDPAIIPYLVSSLLLTFTTWPSMLFELVPEAVWIRGRRRLVLSLSRSLWA